MAKKRKPEAECADLVAELGAISERLNALAALPTLPPLWLLRTLARRLATLHERVRTVAGLGLLGLRAGLGGTARPLA